MIDPCIADSILVAIMTIAGGVLVLYGFNPKLGPWACKYMHWHLDPLKTLNRPPYNICSRCGTKLFMDEDGVWKE